MHGFSSLTIHAAGKKKKGNITNVLLLFMTETGEGKCETINVELKM